MNNFQDNGVGASPCVRPFAYEQCPLPANGRDVGANGRTQGDAPTPLQEGHCITCSDEALTAKVLRVDEQMGLASVTIEDALDEVDITLLDDVAEGDLLLVHGGVAIANIGCACVGRAPLSGGPSPTCPSPTCPSSAYTTIPMTDETHNA